MKRKQDALESKYRPLKEESSIIIPPDIQDGIRRVLEFRKSLGLQDDSKERWERAIRYWQR